MLKSDILDPGYACKPEIYKDGDFVRQVAPMTFNVRPAFATYKNAEIDFDVVSSPRSETIRRSLRVLRALASVRLQR